MAFRAPKECEGNGRGKAERGQWRSEEERKRRALKEERKFEFVGSNGDEGRQKNGDHVVCTRLSGYGSA